MRTYWLFYWSLLESILVPTTVLMVSMGPLETPIGSSNVPYRSFITRTGVLMVSNGTIRLLLGPIESSRTIRGNQQEVLMVPPGLYWSPLGTHTKPLGEKCSIINHQRPLGKWQEPLGNPNGFLMVSIGPHQEIIPNHQGEKHPIRNHQRPLGKQQKPSGTIRKS